MADAEENAGVIAPPPLIYAGFLAIGAGLELLVPTDLFPAGPRYAMGSLMVLIAGLILVAALARFHRAATPVEPWKPATAIVRTGPYAWSRNPIYVAMVIASGGIAILADSLWMLALLVPTVAAIHFGVILREERHLEARFGQEYRDYKASVRRWI